MDAYRHLTRDDLRAAVAYAANIIAGEDVVIRSPENA